MGLLGRIGAHHGLSCADLGGILGHLGPILGHLGGSKMVILCGTSFNNGDLAGDVLQKWQDGDVNPAS